MRSIKYYLILLSMFLIYFGCSEVQNDLTEPAKVSVHGTGVMSKSSDTFHGKVLVDKKFDDCRRCHAQDLSGGTAQVNCASSECHPTIKVHTADINNLTANGFHGKYIANLNWSMKDCVKCHGLNYAGGVTSPSCNKCHTQASGPEACNTCHGDFSKSSQVAPPRALNNATATTDPGVGAHTYHLTSIKLMANNVKCSECHLVPQQFSSSGHIDNSSKAELIFSGITDSGPSKTNYNFTTNQCSNSFCHGNFSYSKATSKYPLAYAEDFIIGNNYSPKWTKVDGTEGKCGTCHGLPPKGHIQSTLRSCATCHQGVVDDKGNIIDKTKHINGLVNVFGN